MTSKTNLVRPSRDGDQFHYMWAVRRCLHLLSAQNDLVAISIEGPSPAESAGKPPATAGEENIDIAEYFESEVFQDARLVRYMQLKHSTLHATEPWTASGLNKTVESFAKRYRELLQTFSADTLAGKLEFWFVTNRPIATDFAEAVADAAAGAPPRHPGELQKLERFTGLKGGALTTFSVLLHFEDRQDDYWDQRNILFQEVQGYLPDSDVDAPLRLKELVTRKALSEGERDPTITKMDVLRALGTDETMLFPAPCLIKSLDAAVPRAQESDLIRAIIEATGPVVLHAAAGVGKTVFATQIARGLPDGSSCVLFDCFGNGQYRNASGYRHRHKDALVQIANELAAQGLCHLLVPSPHADASAYVRAFVYRLNQAATLLRLASPNALLCIVVDAADNAQMAAEEIGEARSFVRDIIREKMPGNVRLVFLCRSHRQAYLDPPLEALRHELRPFSREETAGNLRQRFPDAGEQDIDEFHRLSSQNPRVQALVLSRDLALPDTLRLLGPNPATVEDSIGSLLEGAIAKLKDSVGPVERAQVDKVCAGLAALRPLIPISILSRISGVDEEAIRSFAIDLGRPLLIADDAIHFFDEPAETWFREKFKPSADAMVEFIAGMKALASASAYVASALPQLMLEAGKFSELVEMALTSTTLPETSPLEKRDVELQRLQFALKAALRSRRYLDAAKLTLKAGGETAGDDRQRKILQTNTDLAATFLGTDLIQDIVSRRTFGSGWLGSHHAYEAALLSGRRELVGDARSRLRMAYEWLHNWSRLPLEERQDEEITDQDIVELTLAQLNIHGPAEAAHSLRSWRPRTLSFRVGQIVARRLIDHGRLHEVEAFACAAGNNICLVLAVTLELREIQRPLPANVTHRAFRLVANKRLRLRVDDAWDDGESALNAVTALVEAALQHKVCTDDEAVAVLSRYLPAEPPRTLSSRFTKARIPLLRAYCLRAALQGQVLELRELAHPELRAGMEKKNQHFTSRELQEFKGGIGALLPWQQLWAATLIGHVTKASLDEELKGTLDASNTAAKTSYGDDSFPSNEIALLWLAILHLLDVVDTTTLSTFSKWKNGLKRPLFTPTLTSLARLCGQKDVTKPAALGLALEAFNFTKYERSDAENKSEGYIDAARAVLVVSKRDAEAFFNEAVEVTSMIGDENLSRWESILDLADHSARVDYPAPELAYRFARCAELTYDYVVRDKHFDWRSTVEALCGLCPSSTLAILSRWRDRGFGRSERILPMAIDRLIELGCLDPRDALPLIGFRAEWTYDRLLDNTLARCVKCPEKEAAASLLYHHIKFNCGGYSKLAEVASRYGMTIASPDKLIAFEAENKRTNRALEHVQTRAHSSAKPDRNWDSIFAQSDLANTDSLALAYKAFKSTEPPWDHNYFFREAIGRLPVGAEAAFIEAVGNNPEFDLIQLRSFLEQAPDTWKARPATTIALARTVKAFCRRYCMTISKNRYYEAFPFKAACALAGIGEAEFIEVVLDAIGQTSDPADSSRLFSLVGLLAIKLSKVEALEALKFGLELLDPVLEDKDGDGPWGAQLLPPEEIEASLAGYIWASLAAPEGSMRWEGAHVVLGLAALGRHDVLGHVAGCAAGKVGGPFVDATLPFYGLHALQWFLIGIARAATEFPEALAPFADQIVDWALMDQPHVAIRQFAARAALALLKHGVLVNRDNLKERLSHVNVSPLPFLESKSWDRIRQQSLEVPKGDDDRDYFGIGIGPYWYAPLGGVFALSQNDIKTKALKVIRTDFGFTGTGRWDEDERSRRKLYAEGHTYHSHGSYPRADSLHFYHAYHAMMIVAGKLLASTPTHRDSDQSKEDEFIDWFDRHDLSRKDGRWLWDRRDPWPLERLAWQERNDGQVVTTVDFDEALQPRSMLNVWGNWTEVDSQCEQSVHVSSALVSRDKSHALLRALGTAKDAHYYAIPSAESDIEIEESGFSLKGWIVDRCHDRGLDQQDPWAGGISFPAPMPARFVIELMEIEPDSDQRLWIDEENSVVMKSQVWGHFDESRNYNSSNLERGNRIQASNSFLTSMLTKLDRSLVIEVKICRRIRCRPQESDLIDERNINTHTRLYLLGADGGFRTI